MARPLKTGIEYFPLDVGVFDDDKVLLVTSQHGGATVESLIIRLLCKIYKEGYYCYWGEDQNLLMQKAMGSDGCNKQWIKSVVQELVTRDFFDKHLYEEYNILTSKGIQRRYLLATKGRKMKEDDRLFWLLSSDETPEDVVSEQETPVNPQETPVSNHLSTQSKVKYSKEKKSKEKESREVLDTPDPTHFFYSKYQGFRAKLAKYPNIEAMNEPLTWNSFGRIYEKMCRACRDEKQRHTLMGAVLSEMANKPDLGTKYNSFEITFLSFMSKKIDINKNSSAKLAINSDGSITSI